MAPFVRSVMHHVLVASVPLRHGLDSASHCNMSAAFPTKADLQTKAGALKSADDCLFGFYLYTGFWYELDIGIFIQDS